MFLPKSIKKLSSEHEGGEVRAPPVLDRALVVAGVALVRELYRIGRKKF